MDEGVKIRDEGVPFNLLPGCKMIIAIIMKQDLIGKSQQFSSFLIPKDLL